MGEASDGQALLDLLKQRTPDLVILDIFLLHVHGLEATKKIRTSYPSVKILIITRESDMEFFFHALYYGVNGYLLEEDAKVTLLSAIEMIKKGKYYVSPSIVFRFLHINVKDYNNRRGFFSPLSYQLSGWEKEILILISMGNSNQEIACVLNLSVRTIYHHRARIMKKLHCRHSTDLVKYAIQKLPLFF